METAYDLLAAQPFLDGLTDHQLERLSYWSKRAMFHAGNRVFHEGDHADRFWLISRGKVNLDTHIPGRGDVVVETLGPGAVLGWSWLFPPYRWHFGAVAVENTFTVSLDGAGLRGLCDQDPILGYELTSRFMRVVVDRLQATRLRLLDLYKVPS
jgi:CRP/FNR family transcriptional regulator, cyclic AMP receptor protein